MADVLKGKVLIVTGAGRGVGAEIAKLAAKEGARVVVNDLGGSEGGEGSDIGPAQQVVNEIKAFGDVGAIVNNAGILRDGIFHKMSEADWDSVLAVNLKGCFNVARAAAPHFKDKQKGAFVHMTSTSGLIGNFGQVNYGAAKLGVMGLSKCIALDMTKSVCARTALHRSRGRGWWVPYPTTRRMPRASRSQSA